MLSHWSEGQLFHRKSSPLCQGLTPSILPRHFRCAGYFPRPAGGWLFHRKSPKQQWLGTQGISKDRLTVAGWKLETFGKIFPYQVFASLANVSCIGEFTGGLQVKFLVLHAKVYALAEKYEVSGLKEMAQRCFQLVSNCGGCCSKEFAQACEFVYTTTIDSDRGLRDVVVQALHENPRALDEEHIRRAMRLQPDLPYDLVLYGREKETKKEKVRRSRPSWMNGPQAS